jgi:hypothetical protein
VPGCRGVGVPQILNHTAPCQRLCNRSSTLPPPARPSFPSLLSQCISSRKGSTTSELRNYLVHSKQADHRDSHPWSHVVIGMWHKYPNPHCTHVVTIDVLDRTVDPQTGIIRTERILGCKQKTPTWIVKVRCYVAPPPRTSLM